MKKRTLIRLLSVFCVFLLILCNMSFSSNAYNKTGHNNLMLEILFGTESRIENAKSKDATKILEAASYLAIDQFNGKNGKKCNGEDELKLLESYKVKNIPVSLDQIDFSASGKTHRSYTHYGWNHVYLIDKAHWDTRKQLLVNTVGAVFNFDNDSKKQDSFSAIIYYIHILGDHLDDKSYKVQNGGKIDVGGRQSTDKNDIIDELIAHIKIVFCDQSSTHKYSALLSTLESYNSKYAKLLKNGGVDSDEKFAEKQKLNSGLKKVLSDYLPDMLKEEAFFSEVYY